MSKHKATAAEKRDMASTALVYTTVAAVIVTIYAVGLFLAFAPLIWAIIEVSTSAHPNPGAVSIIILWSLGIITVAILIVRAILKPPRSKPQTRAWPSKAVWPESEFQQNRLGKWAGDEK